MSGNTVSMD